jgi:hypothetical protein
VEPRFPHGPHGFQRDYSRLGEMKIEENIYMNGAVSDVREGHVSTKFMIFSTTKISKRGSQLSGDEVV